MNKGLAAVSVSKFHVKYTWPSFVAGGALAPWAHCCPRFKNIERAIVSVGFVPIAVDMPLSLSSCSGK
jgi:hypothetical protein